jgi:hypothetical protein
VDTIQLQCGSCGQMMAISTAHLGSQVRCPHCQAVVQTPAPAPQLDMTPSAGAAGAAGAPADLGERDSIFGQPEPTDDLFGGGEAPAVRAEPPAAAPPPPPAPRPAPAPAPSPGPPEPALSPFAPTVTLEPAPLPPEHLAPPSHLSADLAPAPALSELESAGEDIAPVVPRNLPKRSMFLPTLLIFLIPYAIFTTAFIAYLLYSWPRDNPLRRLPDTATKGSARQRVQHDFKLDPDMRVGLGQSLRVGEIEVTPLQVTRNPFGDLMLTFRARNVSQDQVFAPISEEYLRYGARSMEELKPYTFLERQHQFAVKQRIYGGHLEWVNNTTGKNRLFDGELNPGQEATIQITSDARYRDDVVPSMLKAPERLLWRVQVRRGLVPDEDGELVSATTVVGVDFAPRDIVNEDDES